MVPLGESKDREYEEKRNIYTAINICWLYFFKTCAIALCLMIFSPSIRWVWPCIRNLFHSCTKHVCFPCTRISFFVHQFKLLTTYHRTNYQPRLVKGYLFHVSISTSRTWKLVHIFLFLSGYRIRYFALIHITLRFFLIQFFFSVHILRG